MTLNEETKRLLCVARNITKERKKALVSVYDLFIALCISDLDRVKSILVKNMTDYYKLLVSNACFRKNMNDEISEEAVEEAFQNFRIDSRRIMVLSSRLAAKYSEDGTIKPEYILLSIVLDDLMIDKEVAEILKNQGTDARVVRLDLWKLLKNNKS